MIEVIVIRVDGSKEKHMITEDSIQKGFIEQTINAKLLDTVNLRDGRFMYVDDEGYETKTVKSGITTTLKPVRSRKPVNEEATRLYHSVCVPGTTHQIVGDVAIIKELK